MKKFVLISSLTVLMLFTAFETVHAENPKTSECDAAAIDAALSTYRFIRAPFRGVGNTNEYFKDLFDRGSCQLNDINNAKAELFNQEQLLKQRLFSCESQEAIKKERMLMYKFQAEVFYLRHFVDTERGLVQKNADIKNELVHHFTQELKVIDEKTALEFFNEFQNIYKDRPKKYRNCKDDVSWQDVKKKAKEFVQTITLMQGIKDEWKKQEEQRKREQEEKEESGAKPSTWQAIKGHLKKTVDFEINNVKPKKALKEIIADIKKQFPGKGVPIQEAQRQLEAEENRLNFFINSAEKRGRYQTLYREAGDKIVDELLRKLDETNKIIKETYTEYLPLLQKCGKAVNSKQCR